MASHSQQFQANKRLKVTSERKTPSQPQLGSSSRGHSGTLMSSQQFPTPRSPCLQATRLFRIPPRSSHWELLAAEQFPREPSTVLTREHHQKEPKDKSIEPTPTRKAITLQSSKETNIWGNVPTKPKYEHAWGFCIGRLGDQKQLIDSTTPVLVVTKHKGPSSDVNKFTLAGRIDKVQEHKGKNMIYFLVLCNDSSLLAVLVLLKDFEITEVNPVSTRDLMIDAMQTRGLTFGRAYTEVMEIFFGSEKTSSRDYMEEEGDEEEDSSSSTDEEVQRDMPPSTVMQTLATSKKQSKKSGKSKESNLLPESEIVPSGLGVPLPDTRDSSSLNVMRESVKQNNIVDPLPIFLPISVIECPPVDPYTRKRPLEVRAVIEQHVHNLKFKMKNNPNAIVLPLLVLVDRQQCPTKNSWVKANAESYTYWVLGGTHSLIAKQELAAEYEHVDTYKMAMCWVYAGLTYEEAKVLTLDHNIDSDFCLEMYFIQKIRFFHNEWVDTIKRGGKVDDNFRAALCEKCGLEVKKKDGEVWDLQEEIFKLPEQGKLKGQNLSKSHASFKGKGISKEDSPKPIPEDMKITPWRQLQGICEKSLIIAILSHVKGGSLSLEQMGEEFERQKTMFHMPRIMIEKLNCSNWDEVVQYHLDSSKPHVLEKYMLLFSNTIPLDFEQFLSWCRLERRKRQQPQSFEITPGFSLYILDNVDESPSHWCVHKGRVEEMSTFVTPRSYTLAIADAPYGFSAPNFVNDDVKIKPNIHGHKLDRLSWAYVQGVINPYQKPQLMMMDLIDLLSMRGEWAMDLFAGIGTTTVSALKRGRNVVAVECDPLQVKFIEQRIIALKELPEEFQEVGMKSMASDPHFFDAFERHNLQLVVRKLGR
ncbi:hypothetical protein GOP47_0025895 [Adiantum capillus-veneris]|uniref:DNA methylase N-4/N-6 domain-containing protein n=1 Tax=Adiantum capillus-veneris TaxID=13818 RepID=A0A9D4Z4K2_ADICA|nr:hypothetical protein GOP47_0025895 [Adiantum capillus-veneris]